jgi:hypothetical protein
VGRAAWDAPSPGQIGVSSLGEAVAVGGRYRRRIGISSSISTRDLLALLASRVIMNADVMNADTIVFRVKLCWLSAAIMITGS